MLLLRTRVNLGAMALRGTLHFPKLQYYWKLCSKLKNAYQKILNVNRIRVIRRIYFNSSSTLKLIRLSVFCSLSPPKWPDWFCKGFVEMFIQIKKINCDVANCLVSYPGHLWDSLTRLQRNSRCILQHQSTGQ